MKKLFAFVLAGTLVGSSYAQFFTTGNLALFVAAASANNTTASIVEINTSTAGQTAINTFNIDGTTMPDALRFLGSATSTGYLSLSDDKTLLLFNGANSNLTSGNTNTVLQRGVGSFDQLGTFTLETTYTGVSGQQSRSTTTLDNANFFIADQNGLYTNGSTSASPTANLRSIRAFGGTVYVGQSSSNTATIQVSTVSAPSSATITGLPGLTNNASFQDFYLISSGANGSTYDVLYVVSATSNTVGTIEKFSLVTGNWVSNGTYSTTFGGFGICAATASGGADLYVSTGQGALINNSVMKLHDNAGFNATINIAASPVNLYTATGGAIIKGVSFAPLLPAGPTIQFASNTQSVLENVGTVNLTVNMTTAANALPVKALLTTSVYTTATGGGTDYTVINDTITFPAGSTAPVIVPVQINDDVISENAEYVSFKLTPLINSVIGSANFYVLYIRDNDYMAPTPTNEVMLSLLTSFSNGSEGTNSSEIVAYDSASQKLVIANSIGAKLDIVDFSNPVAPGPINSINISALGNINSVAVMNSVIAVALENTAPQSNGKVLFYNMAGTLISQVDVGAMPDMVTFNHAGTKVYAVCEGEPNASYSLDPEGTIAVVDISGGVATVTNANVTIINFNAYNGQEATLRSQGIRIYGNNGTATASQDFEPEYITISDDDQKAWVTLQENNAMVILNLANNTITQLVALGSIDHANVLNGMDASDQTSAINIANFPVKGLFLPDAISHMNIGGTNYIFTANEGDAREYSGVNNEQVRVSAMNLDPVAFADQNIIKSNILLGRLRVTNKLGDTDSDGDFDQLYAYGGRGFSVWDENGVLLYNSGNLLEQIIANNPTFVTLFNVNNDNSAPVAKDRSDDKGPELEGVTVANIDGDNLLFASAERLGGVFVFNIDNPVSPRYIGYYNNRSLPSNGPDRGAEGIIYINASASPNGNDLLILANEVSSTLSIYQINTCASASSIEINVTPNDSVCAGDTIELNTVIGANTNVQWLESNTDITGETTGLLQVTQAGAYSLAVANSSLACADTTVEIQLTVLNNPAAVIGASNTTVCAGSQVTLNATGGTPSWNNGVTDNTPFTPAATDMYVATVTDANGCSGMDSILLTVNDLPNVIANVTDNVVCAGDEVIFNGSNATTYVWSGSVTDNVPFAVMATATYTVTGTDANGCSDTATITVTVNNLPAITFNISADSVCTSYSPVNLTATPAGGAFSGTGVTGNSFNPATGTGNYTITYTYTDGNGCTNTGTDQLTVSGCLDIYNEVSDEIMIYPNPATDFIYVKTNDNSIVTLVIYDMTGRQLVSKQISNSEMIDVSVLSNGAYNIQLFTDGNMHHSTLIKK